MAEVPHIRPRHDEADAVAAALEAGLYRFNREATGHRDGRDLAFTVELEGRIAAGVAGYTWGRICEIRELWVEEGLRGRTLGGALLTAAIEEARARGCRRMFLSTYDFQAREFYYGFGFRTVAEVEGKPDGHTEYMLRLDL
jgi:N-acetylglutamate synthase-like GNAT family acetyltransferase